MKELFPTPIVSDWKNGISSPGYGMNLPMTAKSLLPTPKALDGIKGNTQTSESRKAKGFYVDLPNVAIDLMPTTRVSMANGPTRSEIAKGNPKSRIEVEVMLGETNWGKFDPAIRRWEQVIGRPAPAPTKPDGKDNGHRLSSLFTEWLMGLPEGWITGLGLKRNDELKLAGNGVVPQQAELALRILLEDDNLLERIKK
jgi:DNA (cytosine-5)-methyltransferase 1